MPQQPHIIYNPAAGKGHAGKILPQVQELLRKHQFAHTLTLTEGPGHALALSQRVVSIPMHGRKRSFNAAVAFGIAAHMLIR